MLRHDVAEFGHLEQAGDRGTPGAKCEQCRNYPATHRVDEFWGHNLLLRIRNESMQLVEPGIARTNQRDWL